MRALTQTILALLLFAGAAGCDVFTPDAGTTGSPCEHDDHCAGGYDCAYEFGMCVEGWAACTTDQECIDEYNFDEEVFCWTEFSENLCVPWHPSGFGTWCENDEQCVKEGVNGPCMCYVPPDEQCHCTVECGDHDNCQVFHGETLCSQSFQAGKPATCARVTWTGRFGALCDHADNPKICPDEECIPFEALGASVCTRECASPQDCPPGMECANTGDGTTYCGYPSWHGFWHNCGTCPPAYPTCHGGYCTRPCTDGCPDKTKCEADFCVPEDH
jgi:hypothetical protein